MRIVIGVFSGSFCCFFNFKFCGGKVMIVSFLAFRVRVGNRETGFWFSMRFVVL